MPAARLAEIREIYDSGRWRRALDELQTFPVAALLADARALSLWLYLRSNQKTPRPIFPDLQHLLRMPGAGLDECDAALRQLSPEERSALMPDVVAQAERASSPEMRAAWRALLPLSAHSAEELHLALQKETITATYDQILQVARDRFPGDARFQAPPRRPLDAHHKAQLQQEEARTKRKALEDEIARVAALARTNEDLERAIVEDPDDDARRLVHSDWLQAHGDPRGELGALQSSGKTAEAAAFLRKHAPFFLASVAPDRPELVLEWRVGHVDAMRVAANRDEGASHPLGILSGLPAFRFLRRLTVGVAECDENHYGSVVETLCRTPTPFPSLESLFLGDFEYPEESEMSWTDLSDVSPLWAAYPRLRSLKLRGGAGSLGTIEAPELRSFCWETGGLDRTSLEAIVNARWPKLESLEVWFGDRGYGAEGGVDDLARLFAGDGIPALKHLALRNCEFADELIARLAGSPILRRIATLDLSKSTVSDEGARMISAHRSEFAHLAKLELHDNGLSADGVELVRGVCPEVAVERQDDDRVQGDRRYVPVGE